MKEYQDLERHYNEPSLAYPDGFPDKDEIRHLFELRSGLLKLALQSSREEAEEMLEVFYGVDGTVEDLIKRFGKNGKGRG